MRFAIHEDNMERLLQKINRIRTKCEKYGCDFRFEEIGQEFQLLTDEYGNQYTVKYIVIEAEGLAKVNGWSFVASIEHTPEGNIIRNITDYVVPSRYYTTDPVCEHCHRIRSRRDTFLIREDDTGEFKQVGRSCLCDFTGGLSAEGVAGYISLFDELIQAESYTPSFGRLKTYYNTEDVLQYAVEMIRHFGYVKTDSFSKSTRDRVQDYMDVAAGRISKHNQYVINETPEGFNPTSDENVQTVLDAMEYINTVEDDSSYIHNLKTICKMKYIDARKLGYAVSIFPCYSRYLLQKKEDERREELRSFEAATSEYRGKVGDRLDICVNSIECVTGWETQFGYTNLLKIVDFDGNIYMWATSNYVDTDKVIGIRGTVKEHNEYRGVKQTQLTRCKVTYAPEETENETTVSREAVAV